MVYGEKQWTDNNTKCFDKFIFSNSEVGKVLLL